MNVEIKEALTISVLHGDKAFELCSTQQIGDFQVLLLDGVPQSREELYYAFKAFVDAGEKFEALYEAAKAAK